MEDDVIAPPNAPPPIPDRVSTVQGDPFYQPPRYCASLVVLLDGHQKRNVESFCVSEGWARLQVGRTKTRSGRRLAVKVSGKIEVSYRGNNA